MTSMSNREGVGGAAAMKAVSLFSGIGGFDLGLERAGIETVLQVEIDPQCREWLSWHWPDVRRIADVRDVTAADCAGADLLYGGFPCQPASTAGSMKGVADERWLWPEYFRLVREVRPRYVLVENVSGLLHRGLIGIVLGDLASIGYDAEWESLPAAAVGAPHLRYRVFIVSYPAGVRRDRPATDEREGQHETLGRSEQPCGDGAHGHVAHAGCERCEGLSESRASEPEGYRVFPRSTPARGVGALGTGGGWWGSEPAVGRVAHGLPRDMAGPRIKALGNAVVPQVAQYVGERLVAFDRALHPQPISKF